MKIQTKYDRNYIGRLMERFDLYEARYNKNPTDELYHILCWYHRIISALEQYKEMTKNNNLLC